MSALLARTADSGAAVGVAALALAPSTGLRSSAPTAGVLAACLTLPHLLGPWLARRLDRAHDTRRLLAAAFALFGLAVAVGASLLSQRAVVPAAAALLIAGACGPLLTGGLSSRLADLVSPDPRAQRRAEGADTTTYSLAAVAGPATVAGLSAIGSPLAGLLTIAAMSVVAAAVVVTLPREQAGDRDETDAMTVRAALGLLGRHGPLRRVVLVTMVTAISLSVVTLAALVLGPELTGRPAAGATLVAVWGLGSLVGSLVVTWRPIRREPEVSTATHVMVIAVALVLCAVSPTYVWALVAFTVAGIANAPFVAATFAARSSYAPSAARAQVFVSEAGLKVAAAAAGTALGGLALARFTPPVVIALAAGATACAALAAVLDRRRGRR